MTSTRKNKTPALIQLPPEPFGRKLLRAREDIAVMKLEEAVEAMSEWVDTSTSSISRLEHLIELPEQRRTRIVATLLACVYGIDPASIGLSVDELPPIFQRSLPSFDRRPSTSRAVG